MSKPSLPSSPTPLPRRILLTLVTAVALPAARLPTPAQTAPDTPPTLEVRTIENYGPWPQIKEWTPFPIRLIDQLPGYNPDTPTPARGQFGGRLDRTLKATGFFRVEKSGNRWWLVDPEGHPLLSPGICNVGQDLIGTEAGKQQIETAFGGTEAWAAATTRQLHQWGFHSASSDGKAAPELDLAKAFVGQSNRPAYTLTWQLLPNFGRMLDLRNPSYGPGEEKNPKAYIPPCLPVLHPRFEAFCLEQARKKTAEVVNDPWFLGHFSDNELPCSMDALDQVLKAGPGHPLLGFSHTPALEWLRSRNGPAATLEDVTNSDRAAFLGFLFDRYYSTVAAALRRLDPNHLYLGSRLHKHALKTEPILQAAGRHCDVVSLNFYPEIAPSPDLVTLWKRAIGDKPLLISEFYAKGDDLNRDNSNGAGWIVRTQADRGRFYEQFVLRLLEERCFVSWQWFKHRDGYDWGSNKGLVDVRHVPFPGLADTVQRVNLHLYAAVDALDQNPADRTPK